MQINSGSLALGLIIGAIAGAFGYGTYAGSNPETQKRLNHLESQVGALADGGKLQTAIDRLHNDKAALALRGIAAFDQERKDEATSIKRLEQSALIEEVDSHASDLENEPSWQYPEGTSQITEEQELEQKAADALAELMGDGRGQSAAKTGVSASAISAGSMDRIIVKRISDKWVRPSSARNGQRVEVEINLARDGIVQRARVAKTSGNRDFDNSAVAAILSAKIFPEITQIDNQTYMHNYKSRNIVFSPEDL